MLASKKLDTTDGIVEHDEVGAREPRAEHWCDTCRVKGLSMSRCEAGIFGTALRCYIVEYHKDASKSPIATGCLHLPILAKDPLSWTRSSRPVKQRASPITLPFLTVPFVLLRPFANNASPSLPPSVSLTPFEPSVAHDALCRSCFASAAATCGKFGGFVTCSAGRSENFTPRATFPPWLLHLSAELRRCTGMLNFYADSGSM